MASYKIDLDLCVGFGRYRRNSSFPRACTMVCENSEGSDQTAHRCRVVLGNAVPTYNELPYCG